MDTGFFREVELPDQKSNGDGVLFPVVLSPNHNSETKLCVFEEAIKSEKPWLESLLKERGVILFRGFPVNSPSDFNNVVEAFDFPELNYIGGLANRNKVVGRIYTANDIPLDKRIPFHHEMAYLSNFPSKLFFFCEEEPGKGGETPIVLSHIIYEKMKEIHPDFVAQLEEHGIRYIKIMSNEASSSSFGTSWKSIYMTDNKNVAEERAAKQGTKLEWMENGVKIITGPLPAIRFFKETQLKTWFNNLVVVYYGWNGKTNDPVAFAELGNGEPVPNDVREDCVRIMEEECVALPWKKGDVMLVNNLMVLHGRHPLLKPPRRILVSLCK